MFSEVTDPFQFKEEWVFFRELLGAFATLRKAITCFIMSACPYARPSDPTGRMFLKFDISVFFRKSAENIQVTLKPDKNNGHFT